MGTCKEIEAAARVLQERISMNEAFQSGSELLDAFGNEESLMDDRIVYRVFTNKETIVKKTTLTSSNSTVAPRPQDRAAALQFTAALNENQKTREGLPLRVDQAKTTVHYFPNKNVEDFHRMLEKERALNDDKNDLVLEESSNSLSQKTKEVEKVQGSQRRAPRGSINPLSFGSIGNKKVQRNSYASKFIQENFGTASPSH